MELDRVRPISEVLGHVFWMGRVVIILWMETWELSAVTLILEVSPLTLSYHV